MTVHEFHSCLRDKKRCSTPSFRPVYLVSVLCCVAVVSVSVDVQYGHIHSFCWLVCRQWSWQSQVSQKLSVVSVCRVVAVLCFCSVWVFCGNHLSPLWPIVFRCSTGNTQAGWNSLRETDTYRQNTGRVIPHPDITQSHNYQDSNATSATSMQHDRQLIRRKKVPWPCFFKEQP